ncbi:MAG: OmpA family protein [Rhodanobacteraceae bacterium]
MNKTTAAIMLAVAGAVTLGGCTQYVKKADYDAAISKLQATDQHLQEQIDSLSADMQQRFSKYDARLTEMEGRIRVDTVAHFDFNKSQLKDPDRKMLDDFADVMREHHSNALVTVEGFTDPAGSRAYNKRLGQRRADAVRNYLVNDAGMSGDRVRAVSYGESLDRQVDKGETRDNGERNRRVSLVIDFAGA